MPASFEIRVKDHDGILQTVVTDWIDFQWNRRVNGLGWYRLTVKQDDAVAPLLTGDDRKDYQVELHRSNLEFDIDPYIEFEGVHRTPHRFDTNEGEPLFITYGRGYLDLLTRSIAYKAGHARTTKSVAGETAIKEYVNENAGPASLIAQGRQGDAVMPGLSIQVTGAAGTVWDGSRSMRPLIQTIQEIADESGVDFKIEGSGAATWLFSAQASPLGDDRTDAGLVTATGLNGAGNRPVIFTKEFANVADMEHLSKSTEELNVVYVLGQGREDEREVVRRASTAVSDSPYNLREMTRQGTDLSATDSLNALGDAALIENETFEEVRFTPIQDGPWLYGRNYFLGDLVTVVIPVPGGTDINTDKKIVSVTGQLNADNIESLSIELADTP